MHRASVKESSRMRNKQQEKRQAALALQKQKRMDQIALARQMSLAKTESEAVDPLMVPELIQELPEDEDWYFIPIPSGTRCLLATGHAKTLARDQKGKLVKQFETGLPGGSFKTRQTSGACLMEAIYDQEKFYVVDILAWNGTPFYECEAEFRFYWMAHHLQGLDHSIPIVPLQVFKLM